jgi:hypothetical protein
VLTKLANSCIVGKPEGTAQKATVSVNFYFVLLVLG